MTEKDHLDNEIAISAELTTNGVNAKARSRAISGLDRLVGNFAEWVNVRLEGDTTVRRAKIEGEKQLLEAASRHGVERMGLDKDFADRAIDAHFREVLGKQENREGVASEALADLARLPPTDLEANSGDETIDEAVIDRLGAYAAGASTAALRHKWGRLLASEIRTPGKISSKVMRLVDELDPQTALLFERLCRFRLGASIPVACGVTVTARDFAELTGSGLIVPSELGHSIQLRTVKDHSDVEWYALLLTNKAIIVPHDTGLKRLSIGGGVAALELVQQRVQVPVYALTREGIAISSIVPYDEDAAVVALATEIGKLVPGSKTATRSGETGDYEDDPQPCSSPSGEKQ